MAVYLEKEHVHATEVVTVVLPFDHHDHTPTTSTVRDPYIECFGKVLVYSR